MLEAARHARDAGLDVVIGHVESHGRADIESLLQGLEQLTLREAGRGGIADGDLDLDAARARRPGLLLVDELAHSNGLGRGGAPRHTKRWQDIEELRAAGIDVWTTLNVEHLESLNDVVEEITGERQAETIPDRVFDEADEVELIDLPPTELLARLRAGTIYRAGHAPPAVEQFFREPNLVALRELALRRTADRVDAAARAYDGKERTPSHGSPATGSWSRSLPMSRPTSWCGSVNDSRMRLTPNGWSFRWKRRPCSSSERGRATAASMSCGWRSRWAPRRSRWTAPPPPPR